MTCPNCGASIRGNFCEYCGTPKIEYNQNNGYRPPPPTYNYNYYYTNDRQQPFAANPGSYRPPQPPPPPRCEKCSDSEKNILVCLILCLCSGLFGIHRFYAGRIFTGIIYFCTGGLFIFGIFVDLFTILTGEFRDGRGKKISWKTL